MQAFLFWLGLFLIVFGVFASYVMRRAQLTPVIVGVALIGFVVLDLIPEIGT